MVPGNKDPAGSRFTWTRFGLFTRWKSRCSGAAHRGAAPRRRSGGTADTSTPQPYWMGSFRTSAAEMSVSGSVSGSLRTFIQQRLAAAAEEIFLEVERTVVGYQDQLVRYQDQLDRQRKLLDLSWKPRVRLTRIDDPAVPPQQTIVEKEVQTDLGVPRGAGPGQQGPAQVKVEPEEPEPIGAGAEDRLQELCRSTELLNRELHQLLMRNPVPESGEPEPEPKPEPNPDLQQLLLHTAGEGAEPRFPKPPRCPEPRFQGLPPGVRSNGSEHFCPRCGRSFRRVDSLLLHLRTHTGDYLYSCFLCGRGFMSRNGLANHMRIHLGHKRYTCTACGKGFTSRVGLHVHTRTGERCRAGAGAGPLH
ncbi:zinc finger protein 500-like [Cololabis saira]|uniref:zinc finger protein 500-like n=1 Tax=Cololabis saira TaxID=129043 RepID=UPI002AD22366|nr:zinc finger protein 500-like [Cololabis saira]